MERAVSLGYAGLGIADLNGVYGLPKAFWKAKESPGFKLVCGAELRMEQGANLVLHAKTKAGWSLLCRLITASHADRPKGQACLDPATFSSMVSASPGRGGLLCIPRDAQHCDLGLLKDLFGADLFLPLARMLDGRDKQRHDEVKRLCAYFGLPALAVNDAHYHDTSRRPLQDTLACIREGVPLEQAGHRLFSNAERHLKTPAEMRALFSDWPECVDNTLKAVSRCDFSLSQLRYRYPSEWIPPGLSAQQHLEYLANQGALTRYGQEPPENVRAQLRHELDLIDRLGFADYFLTIHQIVEYAREKGILAQGRGSAANSVVCYCLGVTAIDPVKMGLLFERFLSKERAEPPDIDVDFEHERREEVIQHLYTCYGRDRAAMVAAVIKYHSRSSVADISKALGAPQRLKRGLGGMGTQLDDPRLEKLSAEISGFPRHLSIHSGGFVLSDEPLIDLVPVEPARMEDRTVIQWDKYDLDYVGMMKVDVLALGMLSALRRCMTKVGIADLADIPGQDPETYAMICRADTLGVFQIESRAQMNMLGRLRPENFYDLVIQVAIVRPGPIVGKMVHPYLRRRKGEEPVRFEHPALKTILEKTLGVPLFQEQVMRIAVELAGFSPGEADELRRAIGAWRSDGRLDQVGQRLQEGLRKSGLSQDFCDRLFLQIQGFASYGFPESHAASFALLCWASSWLKCHHPAEFAAALIDSQPMGFYAAHSLVDDAKRHGVEVSPVDPNHSGWDCEAGPKRLRLGFRVVAGLGEAKAQTIFDARDTRPFASLDDFAIRSGLDDTQLKSLALGDTFACFGLSPRESLWRILLMRAYASKNGAQLDLFNALSPAEEAPLGFAPFDAWQGVVGEYQAFHLSTSMHPMEALRPLLSGLPKTRAADARGVKNGSRWVIAGMVIVRQRPGTAEGMIFATLEDETGLLDLVLRPDVYERVRERFLENRFLLAFGILQRDRDSASLLLMDLKVLPLKTKALAARGHDWH